MKSIGMAIFMSEAVKAVAESKGISLRSAADDISSQIKKRAKQVEHEEKFGTMPEDYVPELDPDNPAYLFGMKYQAT